MLTHKTLKLSLLAMSIFGISYTFAGNWSTQIINNSGFPLVLTSQNSNDANSFCSNNSGAQSNCTSTLQNGQSQFVSVGDNGSYLVLSYNVCKQVIDGQCSGYLTNVSATLNRENSTFVDKSNQFKMVYNTQGQDFQILPTTPIPSGNFPQVSHYLNGASFRGVNLAGGAFSPNNDGSYSLSNLPTLDDAQYFVYSGMNIVRIPFAWEYLQPNLSKPIDFSSGYGAQLQALVEQLTANGLVVILDMHDYMRYTPNNPSTNNESSNQNIIGTSHSPATMADYQAAWQQIATAFINNKNVIFEVMNEPHDMNTPLTTDNATGAQAVLELEAAALKGIRSAEKNQAFHHLVLLDGTDYSRLVTWTTLSSADGKTNGDVFTPTNIQTQLGGNYTAAPYAIDVHQYLDPDFSGTSNQCIASDQFNNVINFAAFSDWLQANNTQAFLGEFGTGYENSNDISTCRTDLNTLLSDVNTHGVQYTGDSAHAEPGFIGWSAWAGGHAWGSGYILNLSPGGQANAWMNDPQVFANTSFLTPSSTPMPGYGASFVGLINQTNQTLDFTSISGAFHAVKPENLPADSTAYLYQVNGTAPTTNTNITYTFTQNMSNPVYFGFGYDGKGNSYTYPALNTAFDNDQYEFVALPNSDCNLQVSATTTMCFGIKSI